jgi:hypothetical protein
MNITSAARPRVSRETRRLLTAAALALVTLWVLVRIRFPDRAPTANPVAPVLNQIAPPPGFPDLAAEVDRVGRRIRPLASSVETSDHFAGDGFRVPAWPLANGSAAAVLPASHVVTAQDAVVAHDTLTGLWLVTATDMTAADERAIWTAERLNRPRYVFALAPASRSPAVSPAYLSSLEPETSEAWSGEIWGVPGATGLRVGSLLFTSAGEWMGVVADDGGRLVVVPADTVLRRSDQLRRQPHPAGDLGLSVQNLSPAISAATGASTGVIVTWVDSGGPSAGAILVGDVIEAVDADAVPTASHWDARVARLATATEARLQVRRRGAVTEVAVTPRPVRPGDELGLTLARSGIGSRVVRVAGGSAAARAGLRPGDVLSAVGASRALAPVDLRRQFTSLPENGTLLLAVARGDDHHIAVLAR